MGHNPQAGRGWYPRRFRSFLAQDPAAGGRRNAIPRFPDPRGHRSDGALAALGRRRVWYASGRRWPRNFVRAFIMPHSPRGSEHSACRSDRRTPRPTPCPTSDEESSDQGWAAPLRVGGADTRGLPGTAAGPKSCGARGAILTVLNSLPSRSGGEVARRAPTFPPARPKIVARWARLDPPCATVRRAGDFRAT